MKHSAKKSDFPIFQERSDVQHYLDSASTTQKPSVVISAVQDAYTRLCANPQRGAYRLTEEVNAEISACRKALRDFFDVPETHEVIFTHGATSALNALAYMVESSLALRGDILISPFEHHANMLPWMRLAQKTGGHLHLGSTAHNDVWTKEDIEAQTNRPLSIIASTQVSNVLGTEVPLMLLQQKAKASGARFIVDGCQMAAHARVSIREIGCDAYVASAHKMYGPSGVGVLIIERAWAESLDPYELGGGMIAAIQGDDLLFAPLPERFEAGTLPIEGIIGWKAALSYLAAQDRSLEEQRLRNLRTFAMERLSAIDGVTVFGPKEGLAVCSFSVFGAHPHDVATILDAHGVCIRSGHHCAKPLMKDLGVEGLARVSFGLYNDTSDVEALVQGVEQVKKILL